MCDEIDELDEIDLSDSSRWKQIPNPFADRLFKDISFPLDHNTIAYFQAIGDEFGLSAERIMTIYLRNIAYTGHKIDIELPKKGAAQEKPAVSSS
ncbi:hypothetical protein ACFOLJ_17425 [Rugamonas sp. CCM 8940]|uniref:hypothetical protein n=1 Tax=Rugamonas sp. CCM 8940 TaxID=2765359 RepID=UPI0018F3B422|nr:hypothetical protein [Rugamonas sp. CCM 8940]MBJ7310002.1 hypothetical protein [Rugamonas sp. CCM 8940]